MIKKPKIEIIETNDSEIFFKNNYSWKICLNGNSVFSKKNIFSLKLDSFIANKVGKIFPNIWENISNFEIKNKNFLNNELRNYQKEDVEFLKNLNSVAIFNEMRTGKTPTSLFLCKKWLVSRIFVICPSVLQSQWQSSIENWLNIPAYIVSYLDSNDKKFIYEKFFTQNNLALIISKDTFKNDYEIFNEVRKLSFESKNFCVIVDESHFLRNYKSQQSKSIYSVSSANFKIVLTGTPFVNKYCDIFGILKFLHPLDYNSYWKFVNEYFNVKDVEVNKNSKKFFVKVVSNFKSWIAREKFIKEISAFSVRRKQSDILPWLPKVIHQKEFLIMRNDQQEIYDKWLKEKKNSPEKLFNLKSIILYPPHLESRFKNHGIKIDFLVSFCLENDDKQIVIFSTRSATFLEPLSNVLIEKKVKFGLITGKTAHFQRNQKIDDFQSFKIKILLCNIQSTGLGLDLSSADTLIFADRSYSPADNDQAESRFLPPTIEKSNKTKVKLVIDLICKNTIDEKIIKLLEKKKDIIAIMNLQPDLIFGN